MYFGWVFFLISSGSQHVRCTPMWALSTCGEPDEIGLTPMGVKLNGSGRVHSQDERDPQVCLVCLVVVCHATQPSSCFG